MPGGNGSWSHTFRPNIVLGWSHRPYRCSDAELQHNDTQSKDPIPNGKYASPEGRFELRAGSESSQSRELPWLFAHKNVCVYVKPMLFGIARMPNISSPRNIQARQPAYTGSDTKHRRNDHNAHHTVSTGQR
ncbi:hypothetical protein CBL_09009 [Carabus blaptoides fortunei]